MRRSTSASSWLVTIVLLCACAEEERAPVVPKPGYNVTSTSEGPVREVLRRDADPDDLLSCDIRTEQCQVQVFEETSAARGTTAPRPPVSVATEEEFADILAAMGGSGPSDDTAMRVLSLLRLIDPSLLGPQDSGGGADFDGLLAVYFFLSKEVVVLDHGKPLNTAEATLTLSHEYVHALQDAEHDLTALSAQADTTDASQGQLGLVEGEAEVYASLVVASELNESLEFWRDLRGAVLEAAIYSDAPFFVGDLNFPYTFGNEFVTFTWLDGGDAAVAALYDAVPRSSRQILAGASAPEPAGGWVEPITDTARAHVAAAFSPVLEDSLGAFSLHLFLEVLARDAGARRVRLPHETLASSLRGDQVVAFERPGSLVVVWRLRFEPIAGTAAVIATIEDDAQGAFVLREQRGDVLLFASDDRGALDEFVAEFSLRDPEAGGVGRALPGMPRRRPAWSGLR